ncbi:MAG: ATP-binding protein [Halobacteriovoraceae bacterium]|nr:ATP-binding protein [Halobacteriovoraceae bacterium]MBC97025.1 ATP-binding protein [Halobacteriovoraceae bacterium]|tara:strand:- start:24325 stop:25278 length:954 start_codon:yes stop_codon:yes gene_type:complete
MNWPENSSSFPDNLKDRFSGHNQKIWAIGGGKGGVGKSLVTANLSICLSLMGYRVISIDLDLGGANLHTCLGVPIPEKTLSDYLTKKERYLQDLVTPTPIPNLSIISGAQDDVGIANLKQMHKAKILAKMRELDADYVLLDLGAGTTFNTLDFFISADQGILTALPEPTSIENTYRFIKSVYHRKLKMAEDLLEVGPLIDQAMNTRITNNSTPADLINRVIEINPHMGKKLQAEVNRLVPKLIINQVRTQADIDIGFSMKIICKKYFGINLDYAGYLEYDASVWQSVKKRRPLLMEFPNSSLVSNFDRIIHRLLNLN